MHSRQQVSPASAVCQAGQCLCPVARQLRQTVGAVRLQQQSISRDLPGIVRLCSEQTLHAGGAAQSQDEMQDVQHTTGKGEARWKAGRDGPLPRMLIVRVSASSEEAWRIACCRASIRQQTAAVPAIAEYPDCRHGPALPELKICEMAVSIHTGMKLVRFTRCTHRSDGRPRFCQLQARQVT